MQSFKDSKGDVWIVAVDVVGMKAVRAALKVNLYTLLDDNFKGLAEFLGDPIAFVDALYVLCREQAEDRKVTDEDFGRRIAGDSFAEAAAAFTEALIDFFPDAAIRRQMRTARTKGKRVGELISQRNESELEKASPEEAFAKLLEEIERRRSSASPGSSPASSASIPDA